MRKLLYTTAVVSFMLIGCESVDPENEVTIPDNQFLKYLVNEGIDTNGDSIISYSEAEIVTSLNISRSSESYIENLTGIEAFVSLDTFICTGHKLSEIDVSKNKALTYLDCGANELTTLDISQNTSLSYLNCQSNALSKMDLANNELAYLYCGANDLTELDVSNNISLTELVIHDMPSLYELCVWTIPFPPNGVALDTIGCPNVYFTMECSQ